MSKMHQLSRLINAGAFPTARSIATRAVTSADKSFLARRRSLHTSTAARFASAKMVEALTAELAFEKENYKSPGTSLQAPAGWQLVETKGDINMELKKVKGSKTCRIEWQAMAPYDPADFEDPDSKEAEAADEADRSAEFTITIENKDAADDKATGCTFFCQTQQGEENHRFIIGNVKAWTNVAERDSPTGYNGPEYEDLEDKLQESISEWLGDFGVNDAVMDYIDAAGLDKEQSLYCEWLEKMKKVTMP